jgi:hypothetical protein
VTSQQDIRDLHITNAIVELVGLSRPRTPIENCFVPIAPIPP